ncbi:MAG TPA: diguanylate cyclase [Anaerolineae bacterium]
MLQLQIFAHALRRNWWIVVLTAVTAVVAVLAFDLNASPVYRTSSRLLVVPNTSIFEGRDLVYGLDSLNTRSIVFTYVEVANSRHIYNRALGEIGLEPLERGQYTHSAVALPDANVIEITVEGPDAETAALLNNTLAEETSEFVRETYDVYWLNMLDTAAIPPRPVSPTPARDASLALILGLVIGVGLAIARDQIQQPLTQTLKHWQTIDEGSSVFTRSHFENRLEHLLRANGHTIAFVLIQLDGLRDLMLPRPIMKQLLHQVTARLQSELRGKDIIGRWNEYSFAVLMNDISRAEAARILERIQHNLSQPLRLYAGGEEILLQPRAGAIFNQGSNTMSLLVEQAETALAQATMNGSKPVMYSPDEVTAKQES